MSVFFVLYIFLLLLSDTYLVITPIHNGKLIKMIYKLSCQVQL